MAAWTLTSVALMAHVMKKHVGMFFVHPIERNRTMSRRTGDAFADDTGLGIADDDLEGSTHSESLGEMTKMGQSWERAPFSTGGRLELPK